MTGKRKFGVEMVAAIGMILAVCVLGAYQYRWTGQISAAEQARLRNSLSASVRNFEQDFSYDFQQLCEGFELEPQSDVASIDSNVARLNERWARTSSHAELVRDVYFLRGAKGSGGAQLEIFDAGANRFREASWPPELAFLGRRLADRNADLPREIDDREAVYYPWTFDGAAAALIRPIFAIPGGGSSASGSGSVRIAGYLVVALNREYLDQRYLAELVDRSFGAAGQRSFIVVVRTAAAPYRTAYLSDANSPIVGAAPDAAVNLFDLVGEEARRRGHAPLQASDPREEWQLVAQHPAGSLEQAVASWRRRNLAINMGLLAVLAGSMALIFIAARRSRALAKMQMEFVAGVSHELCTPLAVINTAAENLADGVVEDSEQMREYGNMIRAQGHRLGRLVDEVLLFTAGRFGLAGYDVEPVEVAPILAQSLSTSAVQLREAGFSVTQEIGGSIPPIVADPSAAITCVENLVSNAIKYSNATKSIAIRARETRGGARPEVLISVEDKGIGISPADLTHIFEPFYRVQSVRDDQIRGVGLGLYLVKRMIEDMGGRVTVTSELGRGSTFTLHFLAANLPGRTSESSARATAAAAVRSAGEDAN